MRRGTVARWSNDGVLKTQIAVGSSPTGVSIDADGKVWVVNNGDEFIKRIDPATGKVLGYVDLANILPRNERTSQTDVLNGIAWDKSAGRLFVTGKYWPKVYEITVTPQQKN